MQALTANGIPFKVNTRPVFKTPLSRIKPGQEFMRTDSDDFVFALLQHNSLNKTADPFIWVVAVMSNFEPDQTLGRAMRMPRDTLVVKLAVTSPAAYTVTLV